MLNEVSSIPDAKSSKAKRYSKEERNRYIEEWKKSGLSMSQYCKEAKMTASSLSKWMRCKNKIKPEFKPVGFSSGPTTNHQVSAIEIVVENRIKIRFPSTSDTSMITNMVRSLLQWN